MVTIDANDFSSVEAVASSRIEPHNGSCSIFIPSAVNPRSRRLPRSVSISGCSRNESSSTGAASNLQRIALGQKSNAIRGQVERARLTTTDMKKAHAIAVVTDQPMEMQITAEKKPSSI